MAAAGQPLCYESMVYSEQRSGDFSRAVSNVYCNCIVTRKGVYDEISPEPKGNPEGRARGISRGLRRYFIVYPDSSHNTVTVYF